MKQVWKAILGILAVVTLFFCVSASVTPASAKKLTVDYKTYKVKKDKTYKTTAENTEWSGVSVKIDKVRVYKLAKSYKYKSANDGTYKINGFVKLHYVIKNGDTDISIYPTQGTYSFNNSEQHEADTLESWDGDISANVKKTGWVTVPVRKVSNLSSIRAKFDASYETDDYDDDNQYYTYDMTVDF